MRRFDSITAELRRRNAAVRIGFPPLMAPFLGRNVIALTIGRRIWIDPRVLETSRGGLVPLLRHELVHVAQYQRDGIARFLGRYFREYLRNRCAGMSHYDAYRDISYEREAWEWAAASEEGPLF